MSRPIQPWSAVARARPELADRAGADDQHLRRRPVAGRPMRSMWSHALATTVADSSPLPQVFLTAAAAFLAVFFTVFLTGAAALRAASATAHSLVV